MHKTVLILLSLFLCGASRADFQNSKETVVTLEVDIMGYYLNLLNNSEDYSYSSDCYDYGEGEDCYHEHDFNKYKKKEELVIKRNALTGHPISVSILVDKEIILSIEANGVNTDKLQDIIYSFIRRAKFDIKPGWPGGTDKTLYFDITKPATEEKMKEDRPYNTYYFWDTKHEITYYYETEYGSRIYLDEAWAERLLEN